MKNKKFAFRIREEELEIIRAKAIKAKMSVTDYFTASALEQELVVINGLPEMIRELKAIGRNLNQMTILANMERIHSPHLEEILLQFEKIYQQLAELSARKQ